MTLTRPFKLAIDQALLDDLKFRIETTRWINGPDTDNPSMGIDQSYLKKLTDYWANGFDWRKSETLINSFPQYVTEIDGYKIHYLRVKSKHGDGIPLLISHGWPGSFLEMINVIPLLTSDDDISFDVIIPSLIGFDFSSNGNKADIRTALMADLWVKLMKNLGYEKFIAQGGDLGAFVSTCIAMRHPESLIALHLNYIPFNYKPFLKPGESLEPEEKKAQEQTAKFFMAEGGYAQIQSTKPLTLSYGLNDSPVGLCAWLLQIFKSFSDPHSSLDQLFDRDALLAHVTLYWLTETIYTSMRHYPTMMQEPLTFGEHDFIHTPVGITHYKFPEAFPARKTIERGYNVQYWKDIQQGGHFAAMELPKIFAEDLKEFASKIYKKEMSVA